MTRAPCPAPDLQVDALLGRWHIVATTLKFWRGKEGPAVEYADLGGGRWSDTLHWRQRGRAKSLGGVDTLDPSTPGRFRWRGAGLLAWIRSDWAFVAVAPQGRWAVTWFGPATFGITPEGMDVYSREPELPDLDEVLASLRGRSDLPQLEGWYRT